MQRIDMVIAFFDESGQLVQVWKEVFPVMFVYSVR